MPWSTARTIGQQVTPAASAASGCWQLGEVENARRSLSWPGGPYTANFSYVALLITESLADDSLTGKTFTGGSLSSTAKIGQYGISAATAMQFADAFPFGTSDWSVDLWFYLSASLSTSTEIFESDTSSGLRIILLSTGALRLSRTADVVLDTSAMSWNASQWYHLAFCRTVSNSVDTYSIYRDGSLEASVTTGNVRDYLSRTDYAVGESGNSFIFDNLRVTIGVSQFDGPFTPPE